METDAPSRLTRGEGRRFGLTVGGAFLVLAGVARWRGHAVAAGVLASLAGVFLVGGLVVPGRMGPLHDAWMALARAISKVTTPIVMGIVYFLVVTPVGIVRRTLGRHPLRHAERDGGFWEERDERGSDLKRQF